MPILLKIDSSPMGERSISRKLSAAFAKTWTNAHPAGTVIARDLTAIDIPVIDGRWVGAAYTPEKCSYAGAEGDVDHLGLADCRFARGR